MKNKLGSVLLSVVIAFGLWLYVITAVSPGSTETYYDIPVVMEGESVLNENGMMITNVSSNTVTIRLSGNRSDLSRVNKGNITIKTDVSKIHDPGTHALSYIITYPGDVPSNAFVTESKNPGTIQVTVERRETKEVPVEVKWIGSAPEGFMTDRENKVLDYSSVNVTGPSSVVGKIEKATIDVDLNEQRESISSSYQYTLCDAEGNPVDAALITTNLEEIRLEVKILHVKDLRLVCSVIEGGGATMDHTEISIEPATIRVSGSKTALDALGDQISVGTINLSDIAKKQSITFAVTLPEGITNLTGVTEATVTIGMKGLVTKEFTIENIRAVNVPDGMEVELITEKMNVVARGPKDQIDQLTAQDITVEVDFTSAEAGTATYKAAITYADGFDKVGTLRADPISADVRGSK